MFNFKTNEMKIINTFIVCRITNSVFRIPNFFKVYEIELGDPDTFKTGLIMDDRGVMQAISQKTFEELQNNMKELGL